MESEQLTIRPGFGGTRQKRQQAFAVKRLVPDDRYSGGIGQRRQNINRRCDAIDS